MTDKLRIAGALLLGAALAAPAAGAEDLFGLKLDGSFGEGGFDRYVPPITNPVQNETPFITTEAKPFYAYHDIPNDFLQGVGLNTDGGNVNVIGLQLRLALTERLGFIATTDGYSWVDFKNNPVLNDDSGFNDLAFGLKYAFVSDPAGGTILTGGLRYIAPVGSIKTAGLKLNGTGAGYLNPFISGAQLFGNAQIQGSLGAQIALSNDNWTFIHGSVHADYEVLPGLFPALEANIMIPVDGGDINTGTPLDDLTGADILDIRTDSPKTIFTLGGGVRYRLTDNLIWGAGADVNVLQDEDHAYGWRVITDLVIHF